MTRVTISGDGSYQVYVKVQRRSSNRKRFVPSNISMQPNTSGQHYQPSRRTKKRNPTMKQLIMDL